MHFERVVGRYADGYVAEREVAAVAVDAHLDGVVVAHAEAQRIVGAHMYMTPCRDETARHRRRAGRPFERNARCVLQVARDAHGRIDAEREFVGARDLDLIVIARRPHESNAADPAARTDERHRLLGSILTRLREHLANLEPIARAEKLLDRGLRQMRVPRGHRDGNP